MGGKIERVGRLVINTSSTVMYHITSFDDPSAKAIIMVKCKYI